MKLSHLLEAIKPFELEGGMDIDINALNYDSRKISKGDLFVAIKGCALNGHDYLAHAVDNGAAAAVVEDCTGQFNEITTIRVADSRKALSHLAAKYYEYPFRDMEIVGITGTNGKTTTSYILESILRAAGKSTGVIGTNNSRYNETVYPSAVTTPESLDLMKMMREMADHGVTHLVMEVSSHALDQGRTGLCPFRAGIFTNISRDHLDYHGGMDEYFKAKSLLFEELGSTSRKDECCGIINIDDPMGEKMASLTKARVLTYGIERDADFSVNSLKTDEMGIRADISTPSGIIKIESALLGRFNVYNIMAALSAACFLGIKHENIIKGIADLRNVPGRLESVPNRKGLSIVVDYAHTPDALEKAQLNLRSLISGKLITVFGCGGDRDRGKRFDMGFSAGTNSDIIIVTSDNPRSEAPLSIISQIEEGIKKAGLLRLDYKRNGQYLKSGYFIEENRRKAIKLAVSMAGKNDLILIAGKGHENYQIVGSEKRTFDDREEAALAVNEL